MLDFIIAIAHIVSVFANFVGQKQTEHVVGCELVGCVFEFSLVAANLWYAVLAYDLMKAIRNPFGYVNGETILSLQFCFISHQLSAQFRLAVTHHRVGHITRSCHSISGFESVVCWTWLAMHY